MKNQNAVTTKNTGETMVKRGRPNKRITSMMKHINKKYADKSFTASDVAKSYGVQLSKLETDNRQLCTVALRNMASAGMIQRVGKGGSVKRGRKPDLYQVVTA